MADSGLAAHRLLCDDGPTLSAGRRRDNLVVAQGPTSSHKAETCVYSSVTKLACVEMSLSCKPRAICFRKGAVTPGGRIAIIETNATGLLYDSSSLLCDVNQFLFTPPMFTTILCFCQPAIRIFLPKEKADQNMQKCWLHD
uniref:Uncharacterized protein n=1 Tax=Coccidioides posadasii RMSCC 3488 TaxID=454284 RepID=A0A0J6IIQ0_COCPO|nr:hypothetical protein CPAG_08043 [Coccidioides posadasii RMSCC 3488]